MGGRRDDKLNVHKNTELSKCTVAVVDTFHPPEPYSSIGHEGVLLWRIIVVYRVSGHCGRNVHSPYSSTL